MYTNETGIRSSLWKKILPFQLHSYPFPAAHKQSKSFFGEGNGRAILPFVQILMHIQHRGNIRPLQLILQGEVAEDAYGHAVDELAEVLGDAIALDLGGVGLRLGRGGSGSPSRLDVLVLLLEVLVVSAARDIQCSPMATWWPRRELD